MNETKVFSNEKGNLLLEISDDGILANLIIKDNGDIIDENEILDLLSNAKIQVGLDKAVEYIKKNKLKKDYEEPFIIALGLDPEQQANVSYLFDEEKCYDPRKFKSITELGRFTSVSKEQPLAEIIFNDLEQANRDVFGNEIKPAINKNQIIHNFLGENVYYSVYKKQIMASKRGYPYIDEQNRINVKADFTVNRSLNDTVLKIVGDLIVNGDITDSEIEIDGNLKVEGKIWNCNEKGIVIRGNAEIINAENSRIICQGKLKFEKSLRFCRVAADKGLIGSAESSIIGGLIQSSGNIVTTNLGSPFALSNEVELGISPFIKEEITNLEMEIARLKKKSNQNKPRIKLTEDRVSKLQDEYEEILINFLGEKTQDNFIKVNNKVFPEVQIRIFDKLKKITREMNGIIISIRNEELNINES